MKLSNKVYDIMKILAQIILPLLATFIAGVFEIWELPYGVQISATIMAIDTLLGGILAKLSYDYNKNKGEE